MLHKKKETAEGLEEVCCEGVSYTLPIPPKMPTSVRFIDAHIRIANIILFLPTRFSLSLSLCLSPLSFQNLVSSFTLQPSHAIRTFFVYRVLLPRSSRVSRGVCFSLVYKMAAASHQIRKTLDERSWCGECFADAVCARSAESRLG